MQSLSASSCSDSCSDSFDSQYYIKKAIKKENKMKKEVIANMKSKIDWNFKYQFPKG